VITSDLAFRYYKKYLTFKRIPFSDWLEDVYIGLLAEELQTTLHDLTPNNVPYEQYSIETRQSKFNEIRTKGFDNTLFIYEKNTEEMNVLWKFLNKLLLNKLKVEKATKSEFYLNPKICHSNKSLLFIVIVVIAPDHFEKRNVNPLFKAPINISFFKCFILILDYS